MGGKLRHVGFPGLAADLRPSGTGRDYTSRIAAPDRATHRRLRPAAAVPQRRDSTATSRRSNRANLKINEKALH